MSARKLPQSKRIVSLVAAALCCALAAASLTACSGQQASSGAASSEAASAASAASVESSPASEAPTVDTSAWKTLGDAFAARTDSVARSNDENYFVTVFKVGDSYVRAVAKMDPATDKKIDDVDWSKNDVEKQIEDAASSLPLVSAEDITSDLLTRDELDALIGKTGVELVAAGFKFTDYFMYGGEQTGANFDKGYFSYGFTFDKSTPEDETSDEGASVMDAKVVAAEMFSASNDSIDPSKVNE